jgi:hypothetical protein
MRCILNSFAKIAELSAWHEYQKHTSRASSCRHAIFWLTCITTLSVAITLYPRIELLPVKHMAYSVAS